MKKTGVIRKICEPAEWVNSMVVVEKPSEGLRICLYVRDLNKAIQSEYYQLQTFEEIASRLSAAKLFTKLDENIRPTTFNKPFGRYQFTRLP